MTIESESREAESSLDCPELRETKKKESGKESWIKKNLKWVLIGCVVAIVLFVVVLVLILLNSEKKAPFVRRQFKECWSDELIWNDITELSIPSNVCNEETVEGLDLRNYPKLKSVVIGDQSFMYARQVITMGLRDLESMDIGFSSFTKHPGSPSSEEGLFHVSHCPSLKKIRVRRNTFSDYDQCAIVALLSLEEVDIGAMGEWSYNFYGAKLEMIGTLTDGE